MLTNASDLASILQTVNSIKDATTQPYWQSAAFWIGTVLSSLGLFFSIRAFVEASRAVRAAKAAGTVVKIQTVMIDLAEIPHLLDGLQDNMTYPDARDMLAEVNRRLHRIMSPYADDHSLQATITKIKEALENAKAALDDVKPVGTVDLGVNGSVYNAIEGHFSAINGFVAELLGLFEHKTFVTGE